MTNMKKVYQTAKVEIKKINTMPILESSSEIMCMTYDCLEEEFGKGGIWGE